MPSACGIVRTTPSKITPLAASGLASSSRTTPRMMSSLTRWPASITALACEAERRAALDGVAQQVAGGELGQPQRLGEPRALGALAGARRAHEENVHAALKYEGKR